MTVIPWGEYRPDVSDYAGRHSKRVENVTPRADGYGPFRDLIEYADALPAACRGYFVALVSDGSIAVFAGTATKLYKLNNTDLSWTDVSKSGDYTIGAADQWQFAQSGANVIAVQPNTVPQLYTLGSSTDFADLSGSPPQARYVTTVNEFLVLSGLLNNPFRSQWSARSDITGWTAGTDESDFQDFTDGGIVRGVAGGEFGVVFQDSTIRRMIYQPGSPVIFSFDRITEQDLGLRSPFSIIRSRGGIFFLSASGFYRWTGGVPEPIGKERFDGTFMADWDSAEPRMMIGASDPRSTRVMWAYKSVNGETGKFDRILLYDWALQRGALITGISGEYIAAIAQTGITLEGLTSISASIDALPQSLDSYVAALALEVTAVDEGHKVSLFSGDNLEAILETPEQTGELRTMRLAGSRPVSDAGSVFGAVSIKQRQADTETWSAETSLNTLGLTPHRVVSRQARFRNRIPAGTAWTFHVGVEPVAAAAGRR